MSRPTGIFPGAYVFQVPPPAVEASELSELTEGMGEARGPGDAAATTGAVMAAGVGEAVDRTGPVHGATTGGLRATAGATGEPAGAGVGLGFLFFASLPPFGVAVGAGVGDAMAIFGVSSCSAGCTRIRAFSVGGGVAGASPATTELC